MGIRESVKKRKNEIIHVSILLNSLDYFIELVFIARERVENEEEKEERYIYRLIAVHHSRILKDERYNTSVEAKDAFVEQFQYKAWVTNTKPSWSNFNEPLETALEGILSASVNPPGFKNCASDFLNVTDKKMPDIIDVFENDTVTEVADRNITYH